MTIIRRDEKSLQEQLNFLKGQISKLERSQSSPNAVNLSRKNIIDNGDFTVWQKGTTSSSTVSGTSYLERTYADRWEIRAYSGGSTFTPGWTVNKVADHPFIPTGHSLNIISVGASQVNSSNNDFISLRHKVESRNCRHLFKYDNSQPLTLSFWVKTSAPGLYSVQIRVNAESGNDPNIMKKFTVKEGSTWQYVTLTFPPQTIDQIVDEDTVEGLQLYFNLGGSQDGTYASGIYSAEDKWHQYNTDGMSFNGQTNLFQGTNHFFRITDVQLESGAVATPFERLTYQENLQICQRYLYAIETSVNYGALGMAFAASNSEIVMITPFPVEMRHNNPTFSLYNGALNNLEYRTNANAAVSLDNAGIGAQISSRNMGQVWFNGLSITSTTSAAGYIRAQLAEFTGADATTGMKAIWSAEL